MKLASSLVLVMAAGLVSGVGSMGCSSDAPQTGKAGQNLDTASGDIPDPSGVYVANVTANGTGCPAGSWNATIADDGKSFLVTFQAYEATVFPGVAFSIKDCTMGIELKTPAGLSFAVTEFKHAGFASLDKAGMTAKQTAKYYFMGNPLPAHELTTNLTGPFDDIFVIDDQVADENLVWSPCGTTRTLNAQTRLVLQNNSDKSGSGFLDTAVVAGKVDYQFHVGLAWKSCGDSADAGPGPAPIDSDAGPAPVPTTDSDAGPAPGDGTPSADPSDPRGDGSDLDAGAPDAPGAPSIGGGR